MNKPAEADNLARAPREVQRLDAAFREMAGRIAKQAVSIDVLTAEVDRRERAEAEQRQLLVELERSNSELAQFAYVASHDPQEPLRIVIS
jgi:light-regulated signal transduction histidine kinase (bacteriophytochrome)